MCFQLINLTTKCDHVWYRWKTSSLLILFIIVLEPNYGEDRIILDKVEVVVLCWWQHTEVPSRNILEEVDLPPGRW